MNCFPMNQGWLLNTKNPLVFSIITLLVKNINILYTSTMTDYIKNVGYFTLFTVILFQN